MREEQPKGASQLHGSTSETPTSCNERDDEECNTTAGSTAHLEVVCNDSNNKYATLNMVALLFAQE